MARWKWHKLCVDWCICDVISVWHKFSIDMISMGYEIISVWSNIGVIWYDMCLHCVIPVRYDNSCDFNVKCTRYCLVVYGIISVWCPYHIVWLIYQYHMMSVMTWQHCFQLDTVHGSDISVMTWHTWCHSLAHTDASGFILSMHSVNKRRHYIVTSPFIGWAHTQNDILCLGAKQTTIYLSIASSSPRHMWHQTLVS